ncbi:MAG: hypothetical protein AABM64_05990 [Pseudomonadota bacterium]
MTELIFYANAYLKNCEAQVVSAVERDIVLDRDQIEVRPASRRWRPKIVSR